MSESMTVRIGHLGRQIHIYGLNVLSWFVTVDGEHLLRGSDGEKATWLTQRDAKTAAFAFVSALVEDEQ